MCFLHSLSYYIKGFFLIIIIKIIMSMEISKKTNILKTNYLERKDLFFIKEITLLMVTNVKRVII